MKKLTTLLLSASLFAFGCGDDDGGGSADANNPTADAMDMSPDATVTPQMPALGTTQIDRAGRPAISTALQATFDPTEATRNAAKDAYNEDASASGWGTAYTGAPPAAAGTTPGTGFVGSLGVFDGLDVTTTAGDGCGNQLAYDLGGKGTAYVGLAGVLADDRLYVNSEPTINAMTSSGCNFGYLAVEANATGVLGNDDCGGRLLHNDVIDTSYNILSTGDVPGVTCGPSPLTACPVTDNVPANDVAFRTTFPYLAAAQ